MKKFTFSMFCLALLLVGCSGSGVLLTERQQIGSVSFQAIQGYSLEASGEDGIFMGSPDAEITVALIYLPNDFFDLEMTPTMIGGEFPEEVVPFDVLMTLGFGNIELQPIHRYHHGDFAGYSRSFTSSSDFGDPIEGEYLFYTVGNHTFIAIGSVVRVEGNNSWDPQGKTAFDAIVESVEFVQ